MTIREIAKLAGVSPSTISKIINNKAENIKMETRERVLKIVKEYNYTPYSFMNNNFLGKNSKMIGVILNNDSYFLKGIINYAQENNYSAIIYYSNNDYDQELKNINNMIQNKVKAIIWEIVDEKSLEYEKILKEKEIYYLITNNITFPYKSYAYNMTKELLEYNHEKIGCVLSSCNKNFETGYKKALFDKNISFDNNFIFNEIDNNTILKIKNNKITALIFDEYIKALSFYKNFLDCHYRIPRDLSIVTLKNNHDKELTNNISYLNISYYNYGKKLCQKIINHFEKKTKEIDLEKIKLNHYNSIDFPKIKNNKKVIVVGSINVDTYLYFNELPNTLMNINITSEHYISPGGKGVNQSIGISKLGGDVTLLGVVGDDIDGDNIYNILNRYNVDTSGIRRSENKETGKAYIFVNKKGESTISILSGANNDFLSKDITSNKNLFKNADYLLIQSEIPLETVIKACKIAHDNNVKIILKPSAITYIPKELYKYIDIILPNQIEINELIRDEIEIKDKAQKLLDYGVKTVIVTMGENGCYLKNNKFDKIFPAIKTKVIDSTGASDAFISTLVSYLMKDYNIETSIKIAMYSASFSISKRGVISSLIDRDTLEEIIKIKNLNTI